MKYIFITFLSLLTGILFIGISSLLPESIIQVLDKAGTIFSFLLSSITLAVTGAAYYYRYKIRQWLWQKQFENRWEEIELDNRAIEGMILPVSASKEGPKVVEWLLLHTKPKWVALLYTELSAFNAKELIKKFDEQKQFRFLTTVEEIDLGKHRLDKPFDPKQSHKRAKELINNLINKKGIRPENIFVDTTGGTVPMSIGIFQAAEEMGISSIYICGQVKEPQERGQGIAIFLSDHSTKPLCTASA